MHRRTSRFAALLGAGAMALAVAAPAFAADPAKLTAVVAVDSTDAPEAGKAWVRVLHGSPDAPAVDVKANDTNILEGVAFGTISEYLPVDAGTYNIKVCAAGTDTCVIDADPTFEDGKKYTVAATNLLADIEAQVLVDAAAADAGKAQVRVVHFSADTPAVDVLTQDGATKVVSNLAYPDATDYLALDAGSYDLKVCAAADNTVCPLDPGALDLAAGKAYSVFAVGSLAATVPAPSPEPSPTAPPTDMVTSETASAGPSSAILAALAIVGLAVVASVAYTRRVSARRTER